MAGRQAKPAGARIVIVMSVVIVIVIVMSVVIVIVIVTSVLLLRGNNLLPRYQSNGRCIYYEATLCYLVR